MRPIVFLHIPKTAGQSIHHRLGSVVGARNISPVLINERAVDGTTLPPGYLMYSGHIDWVDLEKIEGDPFVFTVLRDPRERIGSFYFYMQKTAQAADPETLAARPGLQKVRDWSADDYFFSGDAAWQEFLHNQYFNFYCSYFATRRMQGRSKLAGLDSKTVIGLALMGARAIERIYSIENLAALEADIERIYGCEVELAEHFANTGDHEKHESRWDKLVARFEQDANTRRLEEFAAEDRVLMDRLTRAHRLIV